MIIGNQDVIVHSIIGFEIFRADYLAGHRRTHDTSCGQRRAGTQTQRDCQPIVSAAVVDTIPIEETQGLQRPIHLREAERLQFPTSWGSCSCLKLAHKYAVESAPQQNVETPGMRSTSDSYRLPRRARLKTFPIPNQTLCNTLSIMTRLLADDCIFLSEGQN